MDGDDERESEVVSPLVEAAHEVDGAAFVVAVASVGFVERVDEDDVVLALGEDAFDFGDVCGVGVECEPVGAVEDVDVSRFVEAGFAEASFDRADALFEVDHQTASLATLPIEERLSERDRADDLERHRCLAIPGCGSDHESLASDNEASEDLVALRRFGERHECRRALWCEAQFV